jgi:hypothetical protein
VAAPASPPTAPFVSPPASRDGGRDAYRRPYPESWRRSGGYGHGSPGDDTGRHHRLAPAGW